MFISTKKLEDIIMPTLYCMLIPDLYIIIVPYIKSSATNILLSRGKKKFMHILLFLTFS